MSNDIVDSFNVSISRVMENIMRGEEIQAQYMFNTELEPLYDQEFVPDSPLYFALPLWIGLKEYLNDTGARALSVPATRKENLISIYEEYQEDYKKQRNT